MAMNTMKEKTVHVDIIKQDITKIEAVEQMVQLMKNMKTNEEAEILTMEEINCLVHELR